MELVKAVLRQCPELHYRFMAEQLIHSAGYLPLCIQNIGTGPRQQPAISVAQYRVEEETRICTPLMRFELEIEDATVLEMHPYFLRDDAMQRFEVSVFRHGCEKHPDLAALKALRAFSEGWDRQLSLQGFTALCASRRRRLHPL